MAKKADSILNIIDEDEDRDRVLPEDYPVNEPLAEQKHIDVVAKKGGVVCAFHDKPFSEYLEWVEFDEDDGQLTFVTKGGRLNDLGIEILPLMAKLLSKADHIHAYLMEDGKIRDYAKVQLLIRRTLH